MSVYTLKYVTTYVTVSHEYYVSSNNVVARFDSDGIMKLDPNSIDWFHDTSSVAVRFGDNKFVVHYMYEHVYSDYCDSEPPQLPLEKMISAYSERACQKHGPLCPKCDGGKASVDLCNAMMKYTLMLDDLAYDIYSSIASINVKSANSTI